MKQPRMGDRVHRTVVLRNLHGFADETPPSTSTADVEVENGAVEFLELMGRSKEDTYEELLQMLKTKLMVKLQQGVSVFNQRKFQNLLNCAAVWVLPHIQDKEMREVFDGVVCAMSTVPDSVVNLMSHPADLGMTADDIKHYCKEAPAAIVRPLMERNPVWFTDVKSSTMIRAIELLRWSTRESEDAEIVKPLTDFISRSEPLFRVFLRSCEELMIRNLRSSTPEAISKRKNRNLKTEGTEAYDYLVNDDNFETAKSDLTSEVQDQTDPLPKTKENYRRPIGNAYVTELALVVGRLLPLLPMSTDKQEPSNLLLRWFHQNVHAEAEIKIKKLIGVMTAIKIDSSKALFRLCFLLSSPTLQITIAELSLEAAQSHYNPLSRLSTPMGRSSDLCLCLAALGLCCPYLAPMVFPTELQTFSGIFDSETASAGISKNKSVTLRTLLEKLLQQVHSPPSNLPLSVSEFGILKGFSFLPDVITFKNCLAQLSVVKSSSQGEARPIFAKLHSQFKAIHLKYVSEMPASLDSSSEECISNFCSVDVSYNLFRLLIVAGMIFGIQSRSLLPFHYAGLEFNSIRWQNGVDFHFDVAARATVRTITKCKTVLSASHLKLVASALRQAPEAPQRLAFEWFSSATDPSLPTKRLKALEAATKLSNLNA